MAERLAEWMGETFAEAVGHYSDGRHGKSEILARRLLAAMPQHDGAQHLLGLSLLAQGRAEESVFWLEQAVRANAADWTRRQALAMGLKALGRLQDAVREMTRASELAPLNGDLLVNLANLQQDGGDFEAGVNTYRKAAALAPDNALVRYNLGLSLLTLGRFKEGWAEAEWRWKAGGIDLERVGFPCPAWSGGNIAGKRLLLWSEQGLGDTLMFCRYAPLLAAQGVDVTLSIQPGLVGLLKSLGNGIKVLAEGERLPVCDFHAPLLAVPARVGTDMANIPKGVPYLAAARAESDKWRERLSSMKGLRVGLAWRGNPAHPNDAQRSIDPALLAPLFDIEGIDWVGLQPDPGPRPPPIFNAGPQLTDWSDTAGLVDNLDLVLAVDSSIAHLAGALGRKCWLMLPHLPDWRWMLERTDSPWYPTMTLWRQNRPNDWAEVVSRVRLALDRLR